MAESGCRAPSEAKLRAKVVAVWIGEIPTRSDFCPGQRRGPLTQDQVAEVPKLFMERGEVVVAEPHGDGQVGLELPGILAKEAIGLHAEVLAEVGRHAGFGIVGGSSRPGKHVEAALIVWRVVGETPEVVEVILRPRLTRRDIRILFLAVLPAEF